MEFIAPLNKGGWQLRISLQYIHDFVMDIDKIFYELFTVFLVLSHRLDELDPTVDTETKHVLEWFSEPRQGPSRPLEQVLLIQHHERGFLLG